MKTSPQREIEEALKKKIEGEVRFDALSRTLYSTDASNYKIEPLGVAIPKTPEDVVAILEVARSFGAAVLPRGGGTSLAGQAVGYALVVDFSKHLNRVIEINPDEKTARAEAGIYLGELNHRLKRLNLMFGPDPSTANVATLGGVIGNNATGAHSILYGMAGDNLESARVVLSDGSLLDMRARDEPILKEKYIREGGKGALYRNLLSIKGRYGEAIRADFPKHWRRASGYSLPYLLENPMNPAKLLAGSEGTLAVALDFTLKLVPRPYCTGLILLQFSDIIAAMEAVPNILRENPSALELMDATLINLTRNHPGYAPMLTFIEATPSAILAVEFYGASERETELKTRRLDEQLKSQRIPCQTTFALSAEAQANVWEVRRAGLGLLMSRRGELKPISCIEDVSVPVENLAGYVREIRAALQRIGAEGGFYGHASAGCLHIRPFVNLKTADGVRIMRELTDEAAALALRFGGVMSGEHGDGLQRGYLNEKLFGKTLYQAMRELKSAFDPAGLLNPGKVVNSPSPTENLRFGAEVKSRWTQTRLDWTSDGGVLAAAEMCSGQGICRKLGEGAMCPSFMATRDEAESTRARANALRAALLGELPDGDDALRGVFDLCLSCKACKSECPSAVDAAKMKIEVLSRYRETHGTPLRDRIFGGIYGITQIASLAPRVANFILDCRITRRALAGIGIHPLRRLPRLADETFADWFGRREANQAPKRERVIYFHDTWANFYEPSVGRAAVGVLEAAGFEVEIIPQRACCGRAMLSKGMAREASINAERNVRLLAPYARRGVPIIGTEPSCVLAFRDEYLDLLPKDDDARLVARNSFLLQEFLYKLHLDGDLKIQWRSGGEDVLLHPHCHERAIAGGKAAVEILRLSGCRERESKAGCCGMAGSFGYETEHYEISKTIGEDRLFPAVRSAPAETAVVVTGASCHEQIGHFTERTPVHIAEILAGRIL
ncbi:MAG: FAD-binding and (Fe-S)-binding domain-containing protein [Deltaproteobacteria bacterium]